MPEDGVLRTLDRSDLLERLKEIVGEGNFTTDPAAIRLNGSDIWSAGSGSLLAVVSPVTLDQLAGVVAAVAKSGLSLAPRGAKPGRAGDRAAWRRDELYRRLCSDD
jgi:FAD/FMN-containing dehydrogenase